jgi:chloramphenicol 3-O-phosphotransferase
MKLVFLHGEPASGKLTVARALLRLVPGRLFENHAAIDFARTVFDFGAPGFWELVEQVRLAAVRAAVEHGVPLAAATYCYSEPHDRAQFERCEQIVHRHGGEVLPVFLSCAEEETAARIGNADRVERRKITSMQGLAGFRASYNLVAVPRANCLRLDTSVMPPDETARAIVRHFGLG